MSISNEVPPTTDALSAPGTQCRTPDPIGLIAEEHALQRELCDLLEALADAHWSVRESAEVAMLNFGKDAVEPLIGLLDHKLWTTRFRVARLLGEIGDARAIPALEKALNRPREQKDVKDNITAALRKLRSGVPA